MKSRPKITLENYLEFCKNPHQYCLTSNHVNQIIGIHGFAKAQNVLKAGLLERLRSIDPMVPQRSTLKENISSSAILPLTEVKEDLAYLDWNECPIQSILAVGSGKETQLIEGDLHTNQASSTCVDGKGEKLKRKRNRRSLAELAIAKAASPALLLLTSAEVTPPSSRLSLGSA